MLLIKPELILLESNFSLFRFYIFQLDSLFLSGSFVSNCSFFFSSVFSFSFLFACVYLLLCISFIFSPIFSFLFAKLKFYSIYSFFHSFFISCSTFVYSFGYDSLFYSLFQNLLLICSFLCFIIGLLLTIAFVTLLERRVIASVQRRKGPNVAGIYGLLQPIADGVKLFHKFFLLPKKSRAFLFYAAPVLSFWLAVFLWFLMPFSFFSFLPEFSAFSLFCFISVSSLSIHSFIFLQGSQNRFSLLGSKRAISQMISYDLGFSLIYLTVFSIHKTTSLYSIVEDQCVGSNIFFLFPIWLLFLVVTLAELNRLPFDLVEEESVLVAGFATEYGGLLFAMFFLAEYGMMLVFSAISVFLFWGGVLSSSFLFFTPFVLFSILTIAHMFFYIIIRATLPRYRYDQLLKIGWKFILPLCGFFCVLFIGIDFVIELCLVPFFLNV